MIEKIKHAKHPSERKEYMIKQLKKEVEVWKVLDHPNILKFIDYSETPNNIYLFS